MLLKGNKNRQKEINAEERMCRKNEEKKTEVRELKQGNEYREVLIWFALVLWDIKHCWLFNAKSYFYIYIEIYDLLRHFVGTHS